MKTRSEELDKASEALKTDPAQEEAFYKALYKFVSNHRLSAMDPDETQEAVVRVWSKLDSYKGTNGAKFSTWAFEVVQNSMQSNRRKEISRQRQETSLNVILENGGEGHLGESPILSPEQAQIAAKALQSLTERQKEVVGLLREGYTEKEAGELLGLSQSTVHQHWNSGLKRLRER